MILDKKTQIQKVFTGLVAVPIACLEYGVYFNYLSQPFVHPGYYIGNVLEGQLLSKYMIAHAVICLFVAVITGVIVHRKVKPGVLESALYFVACACIALPLSVFCVGVAFLISVLISLQLYSGSYIILGIMYLLMAAAYFGGLIISSRLCIRTAKDMNKR